MRRELTEITQQRKVKIEMLRVELGMRCDLDRARELSKQLAMDGRNVDALRVWHRLHCALRRRSGRR